MQLEADRDRPLQYEEIAKLSKSANVGAALPISTVFEPYLSVFVDAQDKWVFPLTSPGMTH